jgi:phosphoenolpyruvate carboxylase
MRVGLKSNAHARTPPLLKKSSTAIIKATLLGRLADSLTLVIKVSLTSYAKTMSPYALTERLIKMTSLDHQINNALSKLQNIQALLDEAPIDKLTAEQKLHYTMKLNALRNEILDHSKKASEQR